MQEVSWIAGSGAVQSLVPADKYFGSAEIAASIGSPQACTIGSHACIVPV